MAGEAGYPWTVMQKTRDQNEGGDRTIGPWIVAWRFNPGQPILVMSERILANLAAPSASVSEDGGKPIGLYMDAQQEHPFLFKNLDSAVRICREVGGRLFKHPRWSTKFDCKTVTKEELDKWKIENELEQIASESGPGVSA
jgi:hypothetical protein